MMKKILNNVSYIMSKKYLLLSKRLGIREKDCRLTISNVSKEGDGQ